MQTRSRIRSQSGSALFATFLLLLLLGSLGAASLVYSTIDLRSSGHYRTATTAMMTAESGVLRVLNEINRTGVWHFETQVEDDEWSELLDAWWEMEGDDSTRFYPLLETDPADRQNSGRIVSVGKAPRDAARGVRVRIERGEVASQGAIVLSHDNPTFRADGRGSTQNNDGLITGIDYNLPWPPRTSPTQSGSGIVRPAVSAHSDSVVENVQTTGIGDNEDERFRGLGNLDGANEASVYNAGGPDTAELEALVQRILANTQDINYPTASTTSQGQGQGSNNNRNFRSSSCDASSTLGWPDGPEVTVIPPAGGNNPNTTVELSGSGCGAGILIAYDPLKITGGFEFYGLVIALGGLDTTGAGNGKIYGSLWTSAGYVKVAGNLGIYYSTDGLQKASDALGPNDLLPHFMTVASWEEYDAAVDEYVHRITTTTSN